MRRPGRKLLLGWAITCAVTGCGSQLPPAPAALTGQVVSVLIGGATELATAGTTSQLTATAKMADGTSSDVTALTTWRSLNDSVFRISPTGLMTATGLGIARGDATFRGLKVALTVTITPPGTFASAGFVKEPGTDAVRGVTVTEPMSGFTSVTNTDGVYTLGGMRAGRLAFSEPNYEPATLDVVPFSFDNEVRIQRRISIAAGDTLNSQLAPRDMSYQFGSDGGCGPCRLIRITTPRPGTLRLRLAWAAPAVFTLWVTGQRFTALAGSELTASVQIGAGETIAYVGMQGNAAVGAPKVNFALTTTLQ